MTARHPQCQPLTGLSSRAEGSAVPPGWKGLLRAGLSPIVDSDPYDHDPLLNARQSDRPGSCCVLNVGETPARWPHGWSVSRHPRRRRAIIGGTVESPRPHPAARGLWMAPREDRRQSSQGQSAPAKKRAPHRAGTARRRHRAGHASQHPEAGGTQMNTRAVRYAIVIEKAGSNYSAHAPDLPGVITTGSTPECTERNMRHAIAFHLRELRRGRRADSRTNDNDHVRGSAVVPPAVVIQPTQDRSPKRQTEQYHATSVRLHSNAIAGRAVKRGGGRSATRRSSTRCFSRAGRPAA